MTFSGRLITVYCGGSGILKDGVQVADGTVDNNTWTEEYDEKPDKFSCDKKPTYKFYIKAKGRAYTLKFLS